MTCVLLWVWGMSCLIAGYALAEETLQHRAVALAEKDLIVRELTNRNDHPRIDEVLTYMGLPLRMPYCASFVVWWYNHAGDGKVLPKYGAVMRLRERMASDELHYKMIDPEDVVLGVVKLREGDIPLWDHGKGQGHTGIETRQIDARTFESIEANTQPGESGNQREGGGVYRRIRRIKTEGSSRLVTFGRVR